MIRAQHRRRPITLGRILGKLRRALIRAFDLLEDLFIDADRANRVVLGALLSTRGGITLLTMVAALDTVIAIVYLWGSRSHGG